MKGIVLAGGSGSRLYPVTKAVTKQLLPIYDKPMIYYPISVLLLAGIREILIISTPEDIPRFQNLLGDGSQFGVAFSYKVQPKPEGLAQAFILGEDFIGNDDVCLVLGDNIFYGYGLTGLLRYSVNEVTQSRKSRIFGYYVTNPGRYGVAAFDEHGDVTSIEEKPRNPESNYAVVGLYFYTNEVVDIAKNITPSERGELEITSVNQQFLQQQSLTLQRMGRGFAWLDTGTHESLLDAGRFIETIEKRQGLKIACLEEIAYKNGLISKDVLLAQAKKYKKNQYGEYLYHIAQLADESY